MSNSLIPSHLSSINPDQLPVLLKPVEAGEFDNGDYGPNRRPGPDAEEFDIFRLFSFLRRRIGFILLVGLFGGLLSATIAWIVPAEYTARSQVVVEPLQTGAGATGATVDELQIDTQISLLAARDHLRSVHDSLAADPSMTNSGRTDEHTPSGTPTGIFSRLGELLDRRVGLPDFETFERRLHISQERRSRVISVRYTADDPMLAAAVSNRVVSLFLERQNERSQRAFDDEAAGLQAKFDELDRKQQRLEQTIRQRLADPQSGSGADQQDELRQFQRRIADLNLQREDLIAQQERLRSRQQTSAEPLRILSLAQPPGKPSSLDPMMLILPAIILSLAAGFVLAFLREKFDRTMRSEADVFSVLGLPCAALLPKLSWLQRRRPHEYLIKNPFSAFGEALRAIGSSLQFSGKDAGVPKVVQVTSSVRGEGKTTLAISLAVFATRIKKQVLLVDLDFRDPDVARNLRLDVGKGILDVVLAGENIDDVVNRSQELGIDVLTMSPSVLDPVTILASREFSDVMSELRERYDLIVIDGPPLLGISETRMIASQVDSVLFAVKWGATRRDVARNALQTLKSLGWTNRTIARRVRAVVTQVNLKQHARYKFGDAMELYARNGGYYNGYYRRDARGGSVPAQATPLREDSSAKMAAE